ncbi:hypothetical protein DFH07DRAFT_813476 [Mycena maculata]|uniref:Uncharacterized protein n=1 Tax=Mycena maculata TaxID=230809 RepID=A0AAD7JGA0_9AGAR|nr:hypothetical protein DFH07DRAFT_813476 [Mycena maculata]
MSLRDSIFLFLLPYDFLCSSRSAKYVLINCLGANSAVYSDPRCRLSSPAQVCASGHGERVEQDDGSATSGLHFRRIQGPGRWDR